MDHDRKTEGGASSEPAFDVSPVCLRVRGLFGLTGDAHAVITDPRAVELSQGSARLEHNDVTCGAMTAVGVFLCDVQTGVPHGETFGSVWGV